MNYEDQFNGKVIAGIDEVGRGCLAGPVVAACVIMPKERIEGVTDSKKLSKKKREALNEEILDKAISIGFGLVSNEIIDEINIKEATKLAMEMALKECSRNIKPDLVLVDAERIRTSFDQEVLIKGDELSYSIGCASIIAKVFRDELFEDYAIKYPCYGFATNMGYGTKAHREALKDKGYTGIHRLSFLGKMGDLERNENW